MLIQQEKPPISVVILTFNVQNTLARALQSLQWAREIIVYDTGSTDQTESISQQFSNVVFAKGTLEGFGKTRQQACKLASNPWIFTLDADEWVNHEFLSSIHSLDFSQKSIIYAFRRKNFYRGRWIKGCRWWPDWQKRLFCKDSTGYDDSFVHESIQDQGHLVQKIPALISHEPYRDLSHFLDKLQFYSKLFAEENAGKQKSSPLKALLHCKFAFWRAFLIDGGWKLGYEGWYIAHYQAQSALYKYLMLYERNQSIREEKA